VPPKEVMYRYPAPGSVPLDEDDHHNLYKLDWKLPFRDSEYCISNQELVYDDDDPRQAENFVSHYPKFNTAGKRGFYDQRILDEQKPEGGQTEIFTRDYDLNSDEIKKELWAAFEKAPEELAEISRDYVPGLNNIEDAYNPIIIKFNERDVTGMHNNPRIKETFVELEAMIEDQITVEA
jgi:hypothetical protein